MTAATPEIQLRIAELRQKARDGTMTTEDMKEGIKILRQERLAMPPAKAASRTKTPTASAEDLLSELGI